MRLSHSRLSTLVVNPKKYKAIYKIGLWPKETKPALAIGSAVHWGIENNTCDLQEYFKEHGTFIQQQNYTHEQLLAESMVYGYMKNKDYIMKDILIDLETGEQLELLEELHEITLTAELDSYLEDVEHSFLGIIDLLLLTNKGFIVLDYKTSSRTPDWNSYLEQIYRYIFLLRKTFPDVPIYKIGIINLRKATIRQKKTETEYAFLQRLKLEYELNEGAYINYHIYTPDKLDDNLMNTYIDNLSRMADFAEHVDKHKLYWWNYGDNFYGKNEYYDICHGVQDSWIMFNVSDKIYDFEEQQLVKHRAAKEIDMLAINDDNVLNKYDIFEKEAIAFIENNVNDLTELDLFNRLSERYVVDYDLLDIYWNTFNAMMSGLHNEQEITEEKEIDDEE